MVIGIALLDEAADRLYVRFINDWQWVPDDDDREVVSELEQTLRAYAAEFGGKRTMDYLLHTFSNVIRVTDPLVVPIKDFEDDLTGYYKQLVVA